MWLSWWLTFILLVTGFSCTTAVKLSHASSKDYQENTPNITKICYSCGPGTHSTRECSQLPAYNTTCREGWCVKGGTENCTACDPGFAQPASGQPGCVACGPGTWTNVTRSPSCHACKRGFICPRPINRDMVACPEGQYCPDLEMTTGLPCLAGSWCPTEGMTRPIPCPAGYYCLGGDDEPIVCQKNTACPEGSASERPCGSLFYSEAAAVTCNPTVGFWCLIAGAAVAIAAIIAIAVKLLSHKLRRDRALTLSQEITNLIPAPTGPQYSGL